MDDDRVTVRIKVAEFVDGRLPGICLRTGMPTAHRATLRAGRPVRSIPGLTLGPLLVGRVPLVLAEQRILHDRNGKRIAVGAVLMVLVGCASLPLMPAIGGAVLGVVPGIMGLLVLLVLWLTLPILVILAFGRQLSAPINNLGVHVDETGGWVVLPGVHPNVHRVVTAPDRAAEEAAVIAEAVAAGVIVDAGAAGPPAAAVQWPWLDEIRARGESIDSE